VPDPVPIRSDRSAGDGGADDAVRPIPSYPVPGRQRTLVPKWWRPTTIGFPGRLSGKAWLMVSAVLLLALGLWVATRPDEKANPARSMIAKDLEKEGDSPIFVATKQGSVPESGQSHAEPLPGADRPLDLSHPADPDKERGHAAGFSQELTLPRVDVSAPHAVRSTVHEPASGQPPGPGRAARPDWLQAADTPMEGKLERRRPGGRGEGIRYGGGSSQSEQAVEQGLRWLMAHQRQDGSWNFNHISEACQNYCHNPGTEASATAATALALLPFLGAGYTHLEGEYQDVVKRGLDYLLKRAMVISYGVDLGDGSMYGHALSTIVLCEAYGMTQDETLKPVAQGCLKYIVNAQDPKGGGWRYHPGEPGDMTVTGWMLMALKSGQMAHLGVPTPTIFRVEQFLSSVQSDGGAQYGYLTPRPGRTTTAVGLLSRMYTGWRRDNSALYRGISHLRDWGPAADNLYYNYYATQVMFHFGGPDWQAWNAKMRDRLIANQSHAGHESGSWYFQDPYGDRGGRLYNTSLATMILEVYYRYMPLYSEAAVSSEF
jgi:hypothetical protein